MKDFLVELVPSTLSGDRRDQLLYLLTLAVLAAGTLLCVTALRVVVLDVAAVALASAGSAAWLLSNGPAEGGTLVEVQPGNGLVLADLAVVPAGLLVLVLCWRRLRSARSASPRPASARPASIRLRSARSGSR